MSLLSVSSIEKAFNGETILSGVSFRLEWGQKLGMVGRNGAGKTTLLRMLTKQGEPDSGLIQFERGVRYGYLRQEDNVDPKKTILQEAELAFAPVLQMERELRDAEHAMAESANHEDTERHLQEYAMLHDRFDAMGGYDNLRDIPSVLKKLGFGAEAIHKLCGSLSGGEKTRLAIARLLLSAPDILFLDEPTNHLDIAATEWLEGFLRDYGGAVVVVSHDRYFLDRVVTTIAEIERTKMTLYAGNFTAYYAQKEANRKRQAEIHEREQADVARFLEFFDKWKNTPTKRAQAFQRLKWAERIKENATAKPEGKEKTTILGIKTDQRSGETVASLERVTKKYGERTLFENVSLNMRRGERLGVLGPNGAGKSTLIKMLLGREQPTSGFAQLGVNLTVGYFAQDTSDLDLDATVLDNIMDVQEMTPQQARTHLGRFLFSGDDVFRPVRLLSGGEKNKLVLAQITLLHPNLLILDEPTNHLDIDSREALGEMLREYNGTMILISHDRYLLDQVANRIVEVDRGTVTIYDGTYSEFRESRNPRATPGGAKTNGAKPNGAKTNGAKPNGAKTNGAKPNGAKTNGSKSNGVIHPPAPALNAHQLSKERARAKTQVELSEKNVEALEARLARIEQALSAPGPDDDAVALAGDYTSVQTQLEKAVTAWEQAATYAETL